LPSLTRSGRARSTTSWRTRTDNGTGDWSEYRITADAAGTREQVMFRNASANGYVLTTVTIKPH